MLGALRTQARTLAPLLAALYCPTAAVFTAVVVVPSPGPSRDRDAVS